MDVNRVEFSGMIESSLIEWLAEQNLPSPLTPGAEVARKSGTLTKQSSGHDSEFSEG